MISIHALREEGDSVLSLNFDFFDISIHALREEGDPSSAVRFWLQKVFLSTPSARRATPDSRRAERGLAHFYPRPPRGGRRSSRNSPRCFRAYFYPRPPRGGRPAGRTSFWADLVFLSTPSARRATAVAGPARYNAKFLSTPSARRATGMPLGVEPSQQISIHALREEGDQDCRQLHQRQCISIHALREEGDPAAPVPGTRRGNFYPRPPRGGRPVQIPEYLGGTHFYPRPPRGGRRRTGRQFRGSKGISIHALREEGDIAYARIGSALTVFLSTPSARRATRLRLVLLLRFSYFYPRPPRGGRQIPSKMFSFASSFLSTPSARRATVLL